jgi:hypothetical protein
MMSWFISVLLSIWLGGAVVCAEANTLDKDHQIAIAAVIANRVKHPNYPDTHTEVLMQHKQFAPPCTSPTIDHIDSYIRGALLNERPDWVTDSTVAFCTREAAAKVMDVWRVRGLRPVKSTLKKRVVFFNDPS